ncbi:MAG: cytochrome b/b6 domain-containing protein [Pseudomonadota bacterium]
MAAKDFRLKDGPDRYGWISIGLHWLSALLIFTLWFVGDSIGARTEKSFEGTVGTHTTIALGFYVVLWARLIWRLRFGHPKPSPHHSKLSFAIGNVAHYVMLACLAAMLVSGPVMAWSGAIPLRLFDLLIPSPFAENPRLFQALHFVHATAAAILVWTALVHVAGVVKHMVFDRDGTLDRMMVAEAVPDPSPPKRDEAGAGGRT